MENNSFWNDLAKRGALLGAVLSLSVLFESYASLSGKAGLMLLMVLEWILLVVVHFLLLRRYTMQFRDGIAPEEGFTFGKGYGYVMLLSLFAGAVVGVVQVAYLHMIVGYESYIEQMIISMQTYLTTVSVPASMEPMLAESLAALQQQPEPSVLQTAWGAIFNSLAFGAFFGLMIAGMLARAPKPFAKQD